MEGDREKETAALEEDESMAAEASGRAAMYGLLVDAFVGLPGDALLSEIRSGRFEPLLTADSDPDLQGIRDGACLIASYRSEIAIGSPHIHTEALSVDRTRLLRTTGEEGFRPPYEHLFTSGPKRDELLLQVLNKFYRKGGLLLEEGAGETPDFLFVELDFMRRLCLREAEETRKGGTASATREMEREFLQRHLGSWAGAYCVEAGRHARTDFYRGFLSVLHGFIAFEMTYLGEYAPLADHPVLPGDHSMG